MPRPQSKPTPTLAELVKYAEVSIRIGPEELGKFQAQRDMWKADHNVLLDAVAEMTMTSMQMAHAVLTGDYVGPSANAQRMSAAALVIKEGKDLVQLILRVRGSQSGQK